MQRKRAPAGQRRKALLRCQGESGLLDYGLPIRGAKSKLPLPCSPRRRQLSMSTDYRDYTQYSSPPPAAENEQERSGAAAPAPRPMRRYRQSEGGAPQQDERIAVLSELLASLIEQKETAATDIPAREGKAHRFKAASTPGGPPALALAGSGTRSPERLLAEDRSFAPDTPFVTSAQRRRRLFGYWVGTLLFGAGAFFSGRQTAGSAAARKAPPSQESIRWSPENLAQLDRALQADQAGDVPSALRLGTALRRTAGALPGLETYLALLNARASRLSDAQATLVGQLAKSPEGWPLVEIDDAMGFTFARQRHFLQASSAFQEAALAMPFAPESFRLWGESLRRQGSLQNAIAALQEALVRYPVGALEFAGAREYVAYKIRLAQIEADQDADIGSSLPARLAAQPSGYWLLTEAAFALQHGDDPRAAAALQKAQAVLPPADFDHLLGDYFFRSYAGRPAIAGFFRPDWEALRQEKVPQLVYFIDP